MDITIRRAEISDLELLMEWRMTVLREVFSVSPGDPMTELEQENRRYYQRALPAREHIACFARAGQKIVGCGGVCFYQEMPSPDNPLGSCAYLMNIYTIPDFRGHGAGREVVLWLIEQAKERGITKIYLETSEVGKSLYKDLGFSEMKDYMKLGANHLEWKAQSLM